MVRILVITVVIIGLLLGGLVLARNIIVKNALRAGVAHVTGLGLDIKKMNIGLRDIEVVGFELLNPSGFSDRVMLDLDRVYVNYDLGALLKKQINLAEVSLSLKQFIIVKDKEGVLNLDSLKALKQTGTSSQKKQKTQAPKVRIDLLHLKLGKVIYKEYSQGSTKPLVREFHLGIDERFKNVTDPNAIVQIIVVKALTNSAIAKLVRFDITPVTDALGTAFKSTLFVTKDAAAKTADMAIDASAKAVDATKDALAKSAGAVADVGEGAVNVLKKATEEIKNVLPTGSE